MEGAGTSFEVTIIITIILIPRNGSFEKSSHLQEKIPDTADYPTL